MAKRGDKFLVKLAGGDSTPEADATAVRVRSTGTDPDGFLLELVETGPQTGVFIRELVIGEGTDAAAGAVGARHHGEHIEVASIRDAQVRAEVKYEDRVAPPAPEITSPTHRSFCQLTFEPAEKPLGDWTGRDGVFGAALRLERDNENSHLCCRAQKAPRSVHLGSGMAMDGLDLGKFPMLEFEYRLSPRATMNLLWRFKRSDWGWKEVLLTQSKPCFGTIGQVFGAAPDGQWHAARLNLLEMARFTYPGQSSYEVEEVAFMAMVSGGWMKREFGAMPGDYDAYALDNFRVMSYSTQPDARFEFSCRDDSGIAGFSYILDQKQNTQPDTTVDEVEPVTEKESESVKAGERESGASVPLARPAAGTAAPRSAIRTPQSEISWAAKSYRGLTDGRWFFHIRALDGAGNWGPANHYEVVIDTKPPSVSFLKPEKPVSWDGSVAFQLSDETGVDPNSIRLSVVGRALDVYSRGMAYEESTGRLTYTPSRGDGDDRLIFADGEQVRVTVTAKDFAGRAAKPLVATFVSASPLKLFPPNPDGGGDWYRAMPRAELNTGPELEGKVF
ncbi:MAG: hypothetical protein FJ272_19855, partial [Planctomycetes bacterium]|nr:hypothetical protein [Planctomycetota bacterium]